MHTHSLVDSQQRRVMPLVNEGTEEVGGGKSSARMVQTPGSGHSVFALALKEKGWVAFQQFRHRPL